MDEYAPAGRRPCPPQHGRRQKRDFELLGGGGGAGSGGPRVGVDVRTLSGEQGDAGDHSGVSRRGLLLLLLLLAFEALVGGAGAQGIFKGVAPDSVVLGSGTVLDLTGSGFDVEAKDYECNLRSSVLDPLLGDYVTRIKAATVVSPHLIRCDAPSGAEWGLPAGVARVNLYKAGTRVTQPGAAPHVSLLAATLSASPAGGGGSGGEELVFACLGLDPRSSEPYVARFEDDGGGVEAWSPPCAVQLGSTRALKCTTPMWPGPPATARVTVFRGLAALAHGPAGAVEYAYEASCTPAHPAAYAAAPRIVTIRGHGLVRGLDYECRFSAGEAPPHASAAAMSEDGMQLTCESPLWAAGCAQPYACMRNASLEVYAGGVRVCGGGSPPGFSFLSSWLALEPSTGPASGGTFVSVQAGALDTASASYACEFTCGSSVHVSEAVAPLSASLLVCRPPPVETLPCRASVRVLLGGAPVDHVGEGGNIFEYLSEWQGLSPTAAPASGGTLLTVSGLFHPSTAYSCVFEAPGGGGMRVARAAKKLAPSQLACLSPAWAGERSAVFAVEGPSGELLHRGPGAPTSFEFLGGGEEHSVATHEGHHKGERLAGLENGAWGDGDREDGVSGGEQVWAIGRGAGGEPPTLEVRSLGSDPSFAVPSGIRILEDSPRTSWPGFAFNISAGEPPQDLTFQVTFLSGASVFREPPQMHADGTLTFQLAPDRNGAALLALSLLGSGGFESPPQQFQVDVLPVNDPPTFIIPTPLLAVDEPSQDFNFSAAAFVTQISRGAPRVSNEDGNQNLTFVVSGVCPPELFTSCPEITPAGELRFSMLANQFGSANFSVYAVDDGGESETNDDGATQAGSNRSAAAPFVIDVRFVNSPPSFTAHGNVTVLEGSGVYMEPYASDISLGPDNAAENSQAGAFMLTLRSGDADLFSTQPAIMYDGVGAEADLVFQPAVGMSGRAVYNVFLVDSGARENGGQDTSAPSLLVIDVLGVNNSPSFDLPRPLVKVALNTLGPLTYALFATGVSPGASGEAGQALTFVVELVSGDAGLFAVPPSISASDGSLTFELAPDRFGNATFSAVLQDDGGTELGGLNASAEQLFDVAVEFVNQPPSFELTGDVSVLESPQEVQATVSTFAFNATPGPPIPEEASQTLTYSIYPKEGYEAVAAALFALLPAIDDVSGDLTYTLRASVSGTVLFGVRATDSGGTAGGGQAESEEHTFTFEVAYINDRPSFVLQATLELLEDASTTEFPSFATQISAGAGDPQQGLTFAVTMQPGGSQGLFRGPVVLRSDGTLVLSLAPDAFGSADFAVTLRDNGGGPNNESAPQSFTVVVAPVNDPPSWGSVGPLIYWENVPPAVPDVYADDREDRPPYQQAKSFVLLRGGSEVLDGGFAQNISAGPLNEQGQRLTFVVSLVSGDPLLFSEPPTIDPATGDLAFVTSSTFAAPDKAAAQVVFSVVLRDDGGSANGGQDTSSPPRNVVVTVFPAQVEFTISSPEALTPEQLEDITIQTAAQLGIDPSVIRTALLSSPQGRRRMLADAYVYVFLIRAVSVAEAASIQTSIIFGLRFVTAVEVTVNIDTLRATAQNKGFQEATYVNAEDNTLTVDGLTLGASYSINDFVVVGSAGSEVLIGVDGQQLVTFRTVSVTNPTLFLALPVITGDGRLLFELAPNSAGVSNVSVELVSGGGGGGGDSTASFTIVARPTNAPPDFQLPWRSTCVDEAEDECPCNTLGFSGSTYCALTGNAAQPGDVTVVEGTGQRAIDHFAAGEAAAAGYTHASLTRLTVRGVGELLPGSRAVQDVQLGTPGLEYLTQAAYSPDGRHAYAAEFASDSVSAWKVMDPPEGSLGFVERRRQGDSRVRLSLTSTVPTFGACGAESFVAGSGQTYLAISAGCELLASSRGHIPMAEARKLDDPRGNACLALGDLGACRELVEAPGGYLWESTAGWWDFEAANMGGRWQRDLADVPSFCIGIEAQNSATFQVSPSDVRDLRGGLGPAVLRGPRCRLGTDWDLPLGQPGLSLLNFVAGDGMSEALLLDGSLVPALYVASDVATLVANGTLPSAQISVEAWVTILRTDGFAGIAAAAQSGDGYFRGWQLGYTAQSSGGVTFLWSLSVANAPSRRSLAFECPACARGEWLHLVATYDGSFASLYLDGVRVGRLAACDTFDCGPITYPAGEPGAAPQTPLTLGAFDNALTGLVQSHIGALRAMRLYRVALEGEWVSLSFNRGSVLKLTPLQPAVYWSKASGGPAASPSLTAQDAHTEAPVTLRGRFSGQYSCRFAYGTDVRAETAATVVDASTLSCSTPVWRYSLKAATLSVWEVEGGVPARPLWQRACLRSECGFVVFAARTGSTQWWEDASRLGLQHVTGTRATVTLTVPSEAYLFTPAADPPLTSAFAVFDGLGAASHTYFAEGGSTFLLAANYWDGASTAVESTLWSLTLPAGGATAVQSIPTQGAVQWSVCAAINGVRYAAVANFEGPSAVYPFDAPNGILDLAAAAPLPAGPASGASGVRCFVQGGTPMLAVSVYLNKSGLTYDTPSLLYAYQASGTGFELLQELPTFGALSVQHAEVGGTSMLLFGSGPADASPVFAWTGAAFELLQEVPSRHVAAAGLYTAFGSVFLGTAQGGDCLATSTSEAGDECSVVYRWNSTCFVGVSDSFTRLDEAGGGQTLSTHHAQGVARLSAFNEGDPAQGATIFIANFGSSLGTDDNDGDSFLYTASLDSIGDLQGPTAVAVSLDAMHVYVACSHSGQLAVFDRSEQSGNLTINAGASGPLTAWGVWAGNGKPYQWVTSMLFTTNGLGQEIMYATTAFPGSVHLLTRDSATGILTIIDTVSDGDGGGVIDVLAGARSVALSPDGEYLYACAYSDSALTEFRRNTDGTLTYVDRLKAGERTRSDFAATSGPLLTSALGEPDGETPALGAAKFEIDGSHYLVVASGSRGAHVSVWRGALGAFMPFQALNKSGGGLDEFAVDVQALSVGQRRFVFVANDAVAPCRVYEWTGQGFAFSQFLAGAQRYAGRMATFEAGGVPFVAVSHTWDGDTYDVSSWLYRWNGAAFSPHQSIPTNGAMDVAFLRVSDTLSVLAFANSVGTVDGMLVTTSAFAKVGSTLDSGCALAMTIWRPVEPAGFRRIGDAIAPRECQPLDPPSACSPDEPAVLLRDGPWLSRPVGFDLVGQVTGSFGLGEALYVWRPLPAPGFRCLGDVAVAGSTSPPNVQAVSCVSEGLLEPQEVLDDAGGALAVGEGGGGGPLEVTGVAEAWYSVSCSAEQVDAFCTDVRCAAVYAQELHNTMHAVVGAWDLTDEGARQWAFNRDLRGEVLVAQQRSNMWRYNAASGLFEPMLRDGTPVGISTVGAAGIEMFEIPPPNNVQPGAAAVSRVPRYFVAVANRQSEGPVTFGGHRAFDTDSELWEWIALDLGGGNIEYSLVRLQSFAGQTSIPEPHPPAACADDPSYGADYFGLCATYAPGGSNEGFCALDNACEVCRLSCAAECGGGDCPPAVVQGQLLREELSWETTGTLRGASGVTHVEIGGEHFLAFAQGVCTWGDSRAACVATGRQQPQSALLQWDGQRFGDLLSIRPWEVPSASLSTHKYAMRVPAGANTLFVFFTLPPKVPGGRTLLRLAACSLTRGLLGFDMDFPQAAGLRGLAAVAVAGPRADGEALLYTASDADAAVGVVRRRAVFDSLGAEVARLSAQGFWFDGGVEGLSGVRGARSVRLVGAAREDGSQDVEVRGGSRTSELLCGAASLHSEAGRGALLQSWQRDVYYTDCQTVTFAVGLIAGDPTLFSSLPDIDPSGRLSFTLAEEGGGIVVFEARATDNGADRPVDSIYAAAPPGSLGAVSIPRYFTINIAPLNNPPSFVLVSGGSVSSFEDAVNDRVLFAVDLSAGPPSEASQTLSWQLVSYTNPWLFASPPQFSVVGTQGFVTVNGALNAFGESVVVVRLVDSGGTLRVALNKTSDNPLVDDKGFDRTPATPFILNVESRNDPPDFDIPSLLRIEADAGPQVVPNFATNMRVGPASEAPQDYFFRLGRVLNAGSFWGTDAFFAVKPAVTRNGTLSFTVGNRVGGNVEVTITMVDSGLNGGGNVNTHNESFLLVVAVTNFAPVFLGPPTSFIEVAQATEPQQYAVDFATDISAGSLDEQLSQRVTFEVTIIHRGPLIFSQEPSISVDGTLTFELQPNGPGDATISVVLRDDGGTAEGGFDASEPALYVVRVVHVNLPPSFVLPQAEVLAVEGGERRVIQGFATELSKGDETEEDQTLYFNLSYSSRTPDLFAESPEVDSQGTLTFRGAEGKHGVADGRIILRDDGGTEQGGRDTSVRGYRPFRIHLLPRPRIASVTPVVMPSSGGTSLTVRGLYFEPRAAAIRATCAQQGACGLGETVVLVGGLPCNRTRVVSDEEAVCDVPEDAGVQTVAVAVVEEPGTVRTGVREAAVLQGTLYYGGSRALGGAFVGAHVGGEGPEGALLQGQTVDGAVWAMGVLRGDLYVGGGFIRGRGGEDVRYVAKVTSGGGALSLGYGLDGPVGALAVYRDALVVGGAFSRVYDLSVGGGASGRALAAWDGERWGLVGGGGVEGEVFSLLVNGSSLYVGGRFDEEGRRGNVGRWDGAAWASLCAPGGGGCGVGGGEVYVMAVMGGDLFVGGSFTRAGDVAVGRVAMWDGVRWRGIGGLDGNVLAFGIVGSQLFAGGEFTSVDGGTARALHVARRSASSWEGLGGGGIEGPVSALAGVGGCVYACGSFGAAGEGVFAVPARSAARYCSDPSNTQEVLWEAVEWGAAADEVAACTTLLAAA